MSIFDKVSGQGAGNQMNLQQLQQDPIGTARQAGYNIPKQLAGNPQAMVQHLLQSGQIGGAKLQQAMNMVRQMTGK